MSAPVSYLHSTHVRLAYLPYSCFCTNSDLILAVDRSSSFAMTSFVYNLRTLGTTSTLFLEHLI